MEVNPQRIQSRKNKQNPTDFVKDWSGSLNPLDSFLPPLRDDYCGDDESGAHAYSVEEQDPRSEEWSGSECQCNGREKEGGGAA